jgi:hypothetical protein
MDVARTPAYCFAELCALRQDIQKTTVTSQVRTVLFNRLNFIAETIRSLALSAQKSNQFALPFLGELERIAISLYREIDDALLKGEITLIHREALSLEKSLQRGDMVNLAQRVDALKKMIGTVFDEFCPSLSERRWIAFARLALEQADLYLQGKPIDLDPLHDPDQWAYEAEMLLAALGDLLGRGDRKEAKHLWSGLSAAQKKVISAYVDPGFLLEVGEAQSRERPGKDRPEYVFGYPGVS